MAKTTRRKTAETPITATNETDVAKTIDVTADNQEAVIDIMQDDQDDVVETDVIDETQTDNTPIDMFVEPASIEIEEIEDDAAMNDAAPIQQPKNTIAVINNATRDFLEPATRTLLKSGEITYIPLKVSKERIVKNLKQLNYFHGNCLVIGGVA